ncbi:transmembrane protein [Cystoisospora suis]|uniref:Transmembrane protein n=1 Tax=Cystoisospora suis TaxID=483139 RepID=A0A2C6KF60_9APIC|nr:transmembrane protein [Cystoisospora suis]
MLFPSLFSIEEAAKKKRDKETDPEPISSSSSFHLKEEILLQERPSKKDEFSSTHKDRSDGEEDMGLFSPSSSFSLDCLCDLYERQQRIREKEKQDERRERKRTIDQEGGGRLNPWRTRQQEEEEEEEKGEAVLLNQLKRGLIKLEDLSHTFSSSLVRHLGVYTLPVLFLSSGVFGSIVAFFTFKRRMKSLSSMGVSRQAEPHLLFSHLPPRPQENPCSNTLFSSSSLPSSISPSSSSSSSSFSILAEEMKKNRRKRGDPCQSMFDDEEEEEAEDSNSLIKQNRQGNPSSPSSSSSSIEVLSFHEIAKLFLLPASSLFLLFGSVWLYLKYSCRFHNVDDFLETLRWLRGTGPAPLLFNSSSSSSLPDQRKKVFLPAADTTSST